MYKHLDAFLLVSRCWNNHDLAVAHKMSVERAIHILREVRRSGGKALARRANVLLQEIVKKQADMELTG